MRTVLFFFLAIFLFASEVLAFSLSDIFTTSEEKIQRGKQYYDEEKYIEAIKIFQNAADHGNAEGQFLLGRSYGKGQGVQQDKAKAVYWYQKAAVQGFFRAQVNLGRSFDLGEGVPKDEAKAVYWMQRATDQGDAKAQAIMGYWYLNGKGAPKDAVGRLLVSENRRSR